MKRAPRKSRIEIEAQRAFRATDLYRVERLLKERSRWQRKQTIASNKLASVQKQLDVELVRLATPQGEIAIVK